VRRDDLVLAVVANAPAIADMSEEVFRVERRWTFGGHDKSFGTWTTE
jgi:hypothetical protein